MRPSGTLGEVWLLYQTRDRQAALRYCNRRLIEASAARGLRTVLVTPEDARARLAGGSPLAVLARSGARLGAEGRALLAEAEARGAVCLPGAAALETARCKHRAAAVLAAAGLPVPATGWLRTEADIAAAPLPTVVKPASGSKGVGVQLVRSREELRAILAAQPAGASPLVVQPFVASSRGRDLRILVAGGRAAACMLRLAPPGGIAANIARGGSALPMVAPPAAAALAIAAAAALGLHVAGVDLLFLPDGFTICEVNTAPGFEALEAETGTDVAGTIMDEVAIRIGARIGARSGARIGAARSGRAGAC